LKSVSETAGGSLSEDVKQQLSRAFDLGVLDGSCDTKFPIVTSPVVTISGSIQNIVDSANNAIQSFNAKKKKEKSPISIELVKKEHIIAAFEFEASSTIPKDMVVVNPKQFPVPVGQRTEVASVIQVPMSEVTRQSFGLGIGPHSIVTVGVHVKFLMSSYELAEQGNVDPVISAVKYAVSTMNLGDEERLFVLPIANGYPDMPLTIKYNPEDRGKRRSILRKLPTGNSYVRSIANLTGVDEEKTRQILSGETDDIPEGEDVERWAIKHYAERFMNSSETHVDVTDQVMENLPRIHAPPPSMWLSYHTEIERRARESAAAFEEDGDNVVEMMRRSKDSQRETLEKLQHL